MQHAKDKNGSLVHVGSRVRLLSLSGNWLNELPGEERDRVLSMVGEEFDVEEIDEYGHPWITKSWPDKAADTCQSHSVALESSEMELVAAEQPGT